VRLPGADGSSIELRKRPRKSILEDLRLIDSREGSEAAYEELIRPLSGKTRLRALCALLEDQGEALHVV